jgi:diguanylate cyclase (GGDEF)-like protein
MDKSINTPISKIMHRHVITTDISTSARECAKLIAAEHVGCLIVTKSENPVGMITERSFVHLVKKGAFDPDKTKASRFMSSPLISIGPEADFTAAMKVFNEKGIKRIPVVKDDKVMGLVSLKDMIEFSNLALANLSEKHKKLKNTALLDPLTGIYNKAAITELMRKEYERIQRYGGRSSILFLDIDHFKEVNDKYSHLAGDAVLTELGILLKSVCREIDTIGRFGGEEFMIIAPNRKKYHAVKFGERLRTAIKEHTFSYNNTRISITCSIGIASLFEGRDFHFALERADKALYHAKNMGRNRIGLWREGKLSIASEHVEA